MAKKKKEKIEVKEAGQEISRINRFNILFVDLQVIFTVLTVICVVWYFFNAKIWHVLQFVLGITLIIIGYNNKIVYNRPKFAYVYYAVGILLMVFEILMLIGG